MPRTIMITSSDRPTLYQVLWSLNSRLHNATAGHMNSGTTSVDLYPPGDPRGDGVPLVCARITDEGLRIECWYDPSPSSAVHECMESWLRYLHEGAFSDRVKVNG